MLSSSARASGADDGDATVSTHASRATVARRASRRDRRFTNDRANRRRDLEFPHLTRWRARVVPAIVRSRSSRASAHLDAARCGAPAGMDSTRASRPRACASRSRARSRVRGSAVARRARADADRVEKALARVRRSRLDRGGGRAREDSIREDFHPSRVARVFFDRRAPRDSARNFIRARARGSVDGIYRYEVSYYKDSVAEWSKAPD